jgi:hypothetical protein
MRNQRIPRSIHLASLALMSLAQVPHRVRSATPEVIEAEIRARDYSLNPARHNLFQRTLARLDTVLRFGMLLFVPGEPVGIG